MEYAKAIALSLNIAGSNRTSIELNEIFVTEANDFTLFMHYSLKFDWCMQLATLDQEDLLPYLNHGDGISDIKISEDASSLWPSTCCRLLTTMLMTNKMCCINVRLCPPSMDALTLQPHITMTDRPTSISPITNGDRKPT
jgi:hypothetical protein